MKYILSQNHSKANLNRLSKIQEEFEIIDGYNYETEIKLILTSLNFPLYRWQQKIEDFSGGEKTRIKLAKILLQKYDLLLLDEPTNHLDIPMICWFEKYLSNLKKPYLIISHDRYFLDKIIKKIIELENGKVSYYSGNYSFYKEESKLRKLRIQKEIKQQQKLIQRTEDFIQRNMAGQKVKQAKSRLKKLNKLEIIPKIQKGNEIKLNFQSRKRSGNDVYRFENISFGFNDNILAEHINLSIFYRDKIALIGENGCGKTTFLKILNQELMPISGIIKKGASLQIGYYEQMHLELDDSLTVKETIWQRHCLLRGNRHSTHLAHWDSCRSPG